jgi:ketosteroid isomerase-like protein
MRTALKPILSLLVPACLALAGPASAGPPALDVVAAEHAFAADCKAMGLVESFRKHVAADGILFRPGPVNAAARLAKAPASDPKAPLLAWWPLWAGEARSGDLGFTTGAATVGGKPSSHYFTVWKKQADGTWKWEIDGGVESADASPWGPDAAPIILPEATAAAGSADKAMAEVRAAEAALAGASSSDHAAALRARLSPEARSYGALAPTARGAQAYEVALKGRAGSVELRPLGGDASAAGDLAWTYGEAAWTEDGKRRSAHYVRIWQDSRQGWKLVFDHLYPDPAPAA